MTSNKKMLGVALASIIVLGGCASSPRTPDAPKSTVGTAYGVYHFEGLPARNGFPAVPAASWTPTEWLDLQDIDASCHRQMDPQIPGIAREVFLPSVKVSGGGAIGTASAAVWAFTGVSFVEYLKYAFGSYIGTTTMSYAERYAIARRYVQYACTYYAVGVASANGRLQGIGIIINPFTGDMEGVAPPTGPASRPGDPAPEAPSATSPVAPAPGS